MCDFSTEDRAGPSEAVYTEMRRFTRDGKYSRIKAGRRKRPPAKALLPAVRAVDGSFQVVRSGVYLSNENEN